MVSGEVVEWFKALVLKTSEVQASVGSNPTLSAMKKVVAFLKLIVYNYLVSYGVVLKLAEEDGLLNR